jgi:ammonium transporter Rh
MVFVGFGYLLSSVTNYGVAGVTFTLLVTVLGLQWAIFTESFFWQAWTGTWAMVSLNILDLLNALYAVCAVLISFGAVIGKVTPFQLVLITIVELIFYSFNHMILLRGCYLIKDSGGTIVIHMFGAYFGLAVAYVIGRPNAVPKRGNSGDIFSLIGTVFLWIYFPTFNRGGSLFVEGTMNGQERAVINTVAALCGSSCMAFVVSCLLNAERKFRVADLQSASLAGGVAIGAIAVFTIHPAVALFVGMLAGSVAAFGAQKLQAHLESKHLLHDTCGVHNLHGLPSIIGGIASVIVAASKSQSNSDANMYPPDVNNQWFWQLCAVVVTLFIAPAAGLFTGKLIKYFESRNLNKFGHFDESDWILTAASDDATEYKTISDQVKNPL